MEPVTLYTPKSVPRDFLDLAVELVTVAAPPVEPYVLFDRPVEGCACGTRDGLAVRGREVLARRNSHPATAHRAYALPPDCEFEETVVVVAWLWRHHFKTFRCNLSDGTLRRDLCSAHHPSRTEGCCERYLMKADPVFMLKSIVLSPYGRGPTLESVRKPPRSSR